MQSIKRLTSVGPIGANLAAPAPAKQQVYSGPGTGLNVQGATVWLIGIGGTWVVLTFLAEYDTTRELAVALAVVLVGSVLMVQGPTAFKNLGVI